MSVVDWIVLHHSASPADTTPEQIREWHLANGWRDVGYQFILRIEVDAEGREVCRIYIGRPFDNDDEWEPWEYGAHTKGFNGRSIGICMVGRYHEDPVPEIMRNAVMSLALCLLSPWGLSPDHFRGHREMPNQSTVCPGVSPEWMDQMRGALAYLRYGEKEGKG